MKNIKSVLLLMTAITLLCSCTKKEIKPELQDTKSTVIKDLPGDVGNTVGSGNEFTPFYLSLKTGAKADPSKVKTSEWDIAFTKEYNSLLVANNGSTPGTPGYGGTGTGSFLIVEKPYDQVTLAPSAAEFSASGISGIGWDSGNGIGWFFYDLKTHIAVPVKNRTFLLRTAEGKYAKIEMVSMYKGAPATVSDLNWPAPYFTFRYYLQEDGSGNLNTQ
ncbi:MAG TPA: HmuY family protein [Pedobacter sp.]|uniref:HmuY family protein n=1 Tax=Pedobacter sp. TaxID=1411316 RepID=UPI002CCB9B49|nr:HmuY family protein [Pedobacter sp.]HMI04351.1 HmuY family protein [Pedobacter sp.]